MAQCRGNFAIKKKKYMTRNIITVAFLSLICFTSLHAQTVEQELDYWLSRHNVQDEGFDMVARYAQEGDTTLRSYLPEGKVYLWNIGRWKGIRREGKGVVRDSEGRLVVGMWHADTLASGIRIDSEGIYAGNFDRHEQAHGHGSYHKAGGEYYEGHWEHDLREGFGFSVGPGHLWAGRWKQGRFLGEKVQYTSERIYGIDISRYQHEKGRRRFGINWQRLRIVSLGKKSNQNVSGTVDYPITFAYIKSTEGISIRNRYFAADYAAARRKGISVGAYHFFSTRQRPQDQASFFLQHTIFRRGDLPPVLDVEPSDKMIEQMGGAEVLLHNMRIWLSAVERQVGVRPIIYVNQNFVHNYLEQAPDLKRDYMVWIARYGEYKPDVRLAIWQLSPWGRVRGIEGEVDINVFNGYQGHWEDFLREEAIK